MLLSLFAYLFLMHVFKNLIIWGTDKMASRLGTVAALVEDPGSMPSKHMVSYNHI